LHFYFLHETIVSRCPAASNLARVQVLAQASSTVTGGAFFLQFNKLERLTSSVQFTFNLPA